MGELLSLAWGALHLQRGAIRAWSLRRDALAEGMALLVGIWLLVGLAGALPAREEPAPAWERTEQAEDNAIYYLERSPLPPDMQHSLERSLVLWLGLEDDLHGLPRPFGDPAGGAISALQRAFAVPYERWGAWMVYSLTVFGLVRALGGRGSLPRMLGAGSLCALPHLLQPLGLLVGWSALLGPLAWGWGALIYLRAVRVTSGLDRPRALLAALLPAAVLLTLALMLLACVISKT